MRWEDWDVLLFGANSHTPIQEFRTLPFELVDHSILTSFVSSQPIGSPFSVSVHSWNKHHSAASGYEIRVIVDGICLATHNVPAETTWPHVIRVCGRGHGHGSGISNGNAATGAAACPAPSTTTVPSGDALELMLFPPFHSSTSSQSHWNALEDLGRIKVELLVDHALYLVFSFQHAPIDLLQRAGIAWPTYGQATGVRPQSHNNVLHGSPDGLPAIASTRSSSSYPFVPASSYTAMVPPPLYPNSHPVAASANKSQASVRLSSDQLQMILAAVSPDKQVQVAAAVDRATSASMPPPPLPPHALAQRLNGTSQQQRPPAAFSSQHAAHALTLSRGDRRSESHYSDISMHAGCDSFPACISEDAEGRTVHSSPSGPSVNVKGRKEGSSPSKPLTGRDFMATVMGEQVPAASTPQKASTMLSSSPGVDTQGRKRTRSALNSLTISDASPEKRAHEPGKPQRKMSRRASASSDKENMMTDEIS